MQYDLVEPEAAYAIRRASATPPPLPPAPAAPRLHYLDEQLLERLRDAEECPVWSLINSIVAEHPQGSRTGRRVFALELLMRLGHLRRLGLAFTIGRNRISATKPDPAWRRPRIRRRRASVVNVCFTRAVSAVTAPLPQVGGSLRYAADHKLHRAIPAPASPADNDGKTQSAGPTAEQVSAAASLIAMRPRPRKRKWTGILHGERIRRRSLVRVPSGKVLPAYVVRRGKVLVIAPGGDDRVVGMFHSIDVVRVKNPEAVLLGSLKRGVRERPSAAKAEVARRNGCLPPRPGSRPRGRPRRGAGAGLTAPPALLPSSRCRLARRAISRCCS